VAVGVFEIRGARTPGVLAEAGAVEFFTCGGERRRVRHWLLGGAQSGPEANTMLLEGTRPADAISARELGAKGIADEAPGMDDDDDDADAYTSWVQAGALRGSSRERPATGKGSSSTAPRHTHKVLDERTHTQDSHAHNKIHTRGGHAHTHAHAHAHHTTRAHRPRTARRPCACASWNCPWATRPSPDARS